MNALLSDPESLSPDRVYAELNAGPKTILERARQHMRLTELEMACAMLASAGHLSPHIGSVLRISVVSVELSLRSVQRKLHAENRMVALVVFHSIILRFKGPG